MIIPHYNRTQLADDLKRPFRFEVWQQEPNVKQRPYRRKTDQRTCMRWHGEIKTWAEVIALVKPKQTIRVRTWLRRGQFGAASMRMVGIHIVNRTPKKK